MKKKTDISNEIVTNFNYSIKCYKKVYQSNHWLYNNKSKIKLFKKNKLKNFRNNGLSEGMDDKFYTKKKTLHLLTRIKKECGKSFLYKMLLKKNIGNSDKSFKDSSYYFTAHELFHIKFVHEIQKKIKLKKSDIICEIGPAYGSMISKLIKLYNSKVILIDLPEANFMSFYYLKKIFPQKKFFVSKDIKNETITKEDIKKNDIIILCPWEKLPDIQINFFINVRSMMEMTHEVIKEYFELIQRLTPLKGFFLCVNRYYKDTVGYPVEMNNYPFDYKWKILKSKTSWMQNHIHFLLLQRIDKSNQRIVNELDKIKKISLKVKSKDKFFLRRVLPNFAYKFYKRVKFSILGR